MTKQEEQEEQLINEMSMQLDKKEQNLEEKNKKIKKQINRFKKLFKKADENKKKAAEGLIGNAAFMEVTLEELREEIKKNGVKEMYVNGKGQFGFKESVESKTYNAMLKNYISVIKQLNEMLPEKEKINEDDEFDRFNDLT